MLVVAVALCSCDQINSILGQKTPSINVTEDPSTNESPNDSEEDDGEADDGEQTPDHNHNYVPTVIESTCTTEGYTAYLCECGKSFIGAKTPMTAHTYENGACTACGAEEPSGGNDDNNNNDNGNTEPDSFDYSLVPEYSGNNYAEIHGGVPYFTKDEITSDFFERYSDLDSLGRVGEAFACLGRETLPTSDRGSLSHNPTGWVQNSYPTSIVSTTQIYNRSHLIAWSLAGENDNAKNLMTGTPYFNQTGMQIFENWVLDYIRETGNHVMYRVTPVFVGNNLLAHGVLMEGWSVEDNGDGICFCAFVYNVQPGVILEYETGNNYLPESDGSDMNNSATLLTDVSALKPGDKIIIVSKDTSYAMGDVSSSGNNRVAVEIKKDGDTVYFGDDVTVITVVAGKNDGTYGFAVSGGFSIPRAALRIISRPKARSAPTAAGLSA